MSDPIAEINIVVTEEGVKCDSALNSAEIVFWLEAVKALILSEFTTPQGDSSE